MTKHNSKFIILMLLSGIFLPNSSFAQVSSTSSPQAKIDFCANIAQAASRFDARVAEREKKLITERAERSAKLVDRANQRVLRLAESRTDLDVLLEKNLTKLTNRASTTEERLAVEKFSQEIHLAMKTRRAVIDAAIAEYTVDIASALKLREDAVDTIVGLYNTARNDVIAKAKGDCAAGTDPRIVKGRLLSGLTKVTKDATEAISTLSGKMDVVKPIADARNAAIEKAAADFAAAVKSAAIELKTKFPNSTK